jgi:hypothetical protein
MDRDMAGFDDATDPEPLSVADTNWVGHVARVPPARTGPRPSWTPAGPASRDDGPPTAVIVVPDADPVPPMSAFRTPAPAVERPLPAPEPRATHAPATLLLLGAGVGAATAATFGAVGLVAVVAALFLFAPSGEAPATPVVVAAAPGVEAPSRAIVTRQVGAREAPTAAVVRVDRRAPPAPKGLVRSAVDAVTSFVAPAPVAVVPPAAPPAAPVVGSPAAAAAVDPAALGLAPAPTPAEPPRAAAPAEAGELSIAGQVTVDRPGSASFGRDAAPAGAPDDLLASLAIDRPAAPTGGGSEPDPMAALLADLQVDPGRTAAPAAPAPASSGGWYDTMVGVGSAVASMVTGGALGGEPASALVAAPSAGFAPDDDEVLRGPKPTGWDASASPDDPTRDVLAALDAPLPTRPGSTAAPTQPARADAAPAAGGADPDPMAALLADLEVDAPRAPAPAPAAAPASSGGWYDTVVGVGSAVASMVTGGSLGGDATFEPAAPAVAARSTGFAPDDDEVLRGPKPTGWDAPASLDDPTRDVLAALDEPLPTRPGAPTREAPRSAPPAADDDGTAALLASLSEDRSPAAAPAAPAPASFLDGAASWAGTVASALLGEETASAWAPAAAPAPAAVATPPAAVAAPSAARPAAVFAAPAPAPAAPAARDCAEGELCDDDLSTWRDDGGGANLLAGDDLELGPVRQTSEAELFAVPSASAEDDSAGFEALSTLLVNVTTDVAGIPVEIDGRKLGNTPLVAELTPGAHTVRLFGGGDAVSTYRLSATRDPDEWCFELRGRSLKNVTCR